MCQTTRDHLEIETFTALLKQRFPNLKTHGGVCDAVFRRQQAVEKMIPQVDAMVIVGSPHSSNANRLREAAERCGVKAVLLDSPAEVTPELLSGARKIGLSAAASTPDDQIAALRKALLQN